MKTTRYDTDKNNNRNSKGHPSWLASKLTPGERRALLIVVSLFALGCLVRLSRHLGL